MHKLKNKLALFVVAFAVTIFALFIVFNAIYIEKKNKINTLETRLYYLENGIVNSFNDVNTLLLRSINDSNVVFTQQNIQLLKLQKNIPKLNREFEGLNTKLQQLPDKSAANLNKIIEYYQSYIAYLNGIVELMKTRSEANTGILPRLTKTEAQIFNSHHCDKETIDKLKYLSRSYLLYKQQEYIDQLDWTVNLTKAEIARKDISNKEKLELNSNLSKYSRLFKELMEIDVKLDFQAPVSYTNKLLEQKSKISNQFDLTYSSINNYKESLSRNSVIFYFILFIIIIAISIVFNSFIGNLITKPLNWLTNNIIKILYNKQQSEEKLGYFTSYKELDDLYKKNLVLLQYLKDQEDKRQSAQKELQQSEKRFRQLTDMLPQSIYETDSLGNLIYVNRAWRKTFGFTEDDLENGVSVIETIVSESGEGVMGQRRFVHSDFIGVRKDGTTFPAIVYSNQILNNGQLAGIRGIIIDNTDRMKYIELLEKEKEKAVELDKQKTNYLADMSHELRTPMNAIIGFADLLSSLDLDNNQKEEFVTHINHSSKHLLQLIDDIIDLAKIESGELKMEKESTDINGLFTELLAIFEENLRQAEKNETIDLQINIPETNLITKTDSTRLKQVLTNLLSNALKNTKNGSIEFGYHYMDKNQIRIFVKDTGKGITPANKAIIFDRYKQINKEDVYKGKGLGLAISKKIVEMFDGNIWVDSEIGKGTCFYFSFPVSPIQRKYNLIKRKPPENYIWKDKLVLVAEDEDLNFRVVKEFVSKAGAKVIRAYDGEEVVEIVKNNHKIDLILMDIKMPRKNGYEATREIKQFNKNIPILALTAYALANEKSNCLAAGCDDYLAKPFKKEIFMNKIQELLSQPIDA